MMSSPPSLSTAISTKRSAKPSSVTLPAQVQHVAAGVAQRARCLLDWLGITIVDDDAGALGGELRRHGTAGCGGVLGVRRSGSAVSR